MVKGHAIIELTNEKTGEVKRVEHDNMLTDALANVMTPYLCLPNYTYTTDKVIYTDTTADKKSKNKTIVNHLMGGIYLFADTLTEDTSNTTVESGMTIVGSGTNTAYSGLDTTKGSYSESESGYQGDLTYKHVWNFTTEQANGTISALALTTYEGGANNYGIDSMTYQDYSYPSPNGITFTQLGSYNTIYKLVTTESKYYFWYYLRMIDAINNIIYFTDSSAYTCTYNNDSHFRQTGVIPLKKMRLPFTKVSPFYDYCFNETIEDCELVVPDEFLTYAQSVSYKYHTSYDDNYAYIYPCISTFAAGSSAKVLKINCSDITDMEVFTITNTTDMALFLHGLSVQFEGDYIYTFTSTTTYSYLVKLNFKTGEYSIAETPIQYVTSSGVSYRGTTSEYWVGTLVGKYYYTMYVSSSYYVNQIFDVETMESSFSYTRACVNVYANGTFKRLNGNVYVGTYDSSGTMMLILATRGDTLFTINNLDEPVTKTSSQSMKVTYIIKET